MNEIRQILRDAVEDVPFDPEVSPTLRRRIRIRRAALVGGASASLIAGLLVISSTWRSPIQDAAPLPPARDGRGVGSEPAELEPFRTLSPGTYVASRFEVPFTFTVGENWRTIEYTRQFVGVERGSPGLEGVIDFHLGTTVLDPRRPRIDRPAPPNLVTWMRRHPYLEVVAEERYDLGDVRGVALTVRATRVFDVPDCYTPCVPLVHARGAPAPLFVTRAATPIWIFSVRGRTVVVGMDVAQEPFPPAGDRFLESVRFE